MLGHVASPNPATTRRISLRSLSSATLRYRIVEAVGVARLLAAPPAVACRYTAHLAFTRLGPSAFGRGAQRSAPCYAGLSVLTHQLRNGSRTTNTRVPERTKHSPGISRRDRLFWIVAQQIAPPVSASVLDPRKIGGSSFRSCPTICSMISSKLGSVARHCASLRARWRSWPH
jgi:hypothetical protein